MLGQHHQQFFAGPSFVDAILRIRAAPTLHARPVGAFLNVVGVMVPVMRVLRLLRGRAIGVACVVDGNDARAGNAKAAHGNTVCMTDCANCKMADAPQGAATMMTTVTIKNFTPCEIVAS